MSDQRDFVDKSVAWDALAQKNAEIASLRAQIAKQSTDLLAMWSGWKVRALKAEAQLASARKALKDARGFVSFHTRPMPYPVKALLEQIDAALTDEQREEAAK